METKTCAACRETFTVDRFIPRKDRPAGQYFAYCKECWCKRTKKYYESHRKERIAYATENKRKQRKRSEVREKERITSREAMRRKLVDPVEYEKHLARNRAWIAANPERVAQYESRQPEAKAKRAKRRYERLIGTPEGRAKLKEEHAKYSAVSLRNRRSRKLKAHGKHTRADVLSQFEKQNGRCFWCAEEIQQGGHTVDHYVPLTKGGSNDPSNLVVACRSCNSRKWALDPDEFRRRLAAR
jgi:5-methylcytosine-specific restriction endonuclease McrA